MFPLFYLGLLTLIIGILFEFPLITVLSILYLVVPTFLVASQNKLTDAIGFDGGIYKGFYIDFLLYVPFIISFIYSPIINLIVIFIIHLIHIFSPFTHIVSKIVIWLVKIYYPINIYQIYLKISTIQDILFFTN